MRLDAKLSSVFGIITAVAVVFVLAALSFLFISMDEIQILPLVAVGSLGIALLLVIGLMSAKLKKEVAKPVSELTQFTQKLTSGNMEEFNAGIPEGELAELAEFLNKLSHDISGLKKYVDELAVHSNKGLQFTSAPRELGKSFFQMAETMHKLLKEHEADFADIAAITSKLSKGDLGIPSRFKDSKEHSASLENLIKLLKGFQADVKNLGQTISNGNFQNSINTEKYEGAWKEAAMSLNEANLAVQASVNTVDDGLTKLARGHFTERIATQSKGELAKLATSANSSLSALSKIVNNISADIEGLKSKARIQGEYPADFAKIRDSLEATVATLNASAPSNNVMDNTTFAKPILGSRTADTNRMSGAKKMIDPKNIGASPVYMRSDYGKY